jgi:hypothetical protein
MNERAPVWETHPGRKDAKLTFVGIRPMFERADQGPA